MAAPELSGSAIGHAGRSRRLPAGLIGATLRLYAAMWTLTLAGALAVRLAGPQARRETRRLLGLALSARATPAPSAGHVLALAAHNIPIAAWPLLLGPIGAGQKRPLRRVADTLVLACLCANTLPVGFAFGGYGSPLLAYIPQLPVEYAGLAVGYGSWLIQRRRALGGRERVVWLAVTVILLLIAAIVETFAVPHG